MAPQSAIPETVHKKLILLAIARDENPSILVSEAILEYLNFLESDPLTADDVAALRKDTRPRGEQGCGIKMSLTAHAALKTMSERLRVSQQTLATEAIRGYCEKYFNLVENMVKGLK